MGRHYHIDQSEIEDSLPEVQVQGDLNSIG